MIVVVVELVSTVFFVLFCTQRAQFCFEEANEDDQWHGVVACRRNKRTSRKEREKETKKQRPKLDD